MNSKIIKNHKDLATHIEGKTVVLMNSLGKDSVTCFEWLYYFAKPKKIISLHFEFMSKHPDDDIYIQYLKIRYPKAEFIIEKNPHELTNVCQGSYQRPHDMMFLINDFEYDTFDMLDYTDEIVEKYNADFICSGASKYESFARAVNFYKYGLVRKNHISPLGLMTKKEIIDIIKHRKIKLHPLYKYAPSTYDTPSYYKMRAGLIINEEYRKNVYKTFPLLVLDKYRWEKMLVKKGRH